MLPERFRFSSGAPAGWITEAKKWHKCKRGPDNHDPVLHLDCLAYDLAVELEKEREDSLRVAMNMKIEECRLVEENAALRARVAELEGEVKNWKDDYQGLYRAGP